MAQAIDTKLWNLMDMFRKLGFSPEEHDATEWRQEWFIREMPGGKQLRVVVHPDDGHRVDLYCLDGRGWLLWDARFQNTPHAVIRASIKGAIGA